MEITIDMGAAVLATHVFFKLSLHFQDGEKWKLVLASYLKIHRFKAFIEDHVPHLNWPIFARDF